MSSTTRARARSRWWGWLRWLLRNPLPHRPLPEWVGPAWTWLVVGECAFRAVLLLSAPPAIATSLGTWVNVLGVHAYGSLFAGAGAFLAVAKLSRRAVPVIVALAFAGGVHVAYGMALMQGASATPGNVTGWSGGGAALFAAALAFGRIGALVSNLRAG